MAFSTKIKGHQGMMTLEILRFFIQYLEDQNATQAAVRSGIPPLYASRYGAWLKKRPIFLKALERELDAQDVRSLKKSLLEIEKQMQNCREILGIDLD